MSKYKILCIDNEDEILSVYNSMLDDLDCEIVTMNSPAEAIAYIKEHGHKIIYIFSDYIMKEMNGIELKKAINEFNEDIPFAMITAHYDAEMAKNGMELRIATFVKKPFQEKELKKLIGDLGEKRRNILEKKRKAIAEREQKLQREEEERNKALLDDEYQMIFAFIEESYPMLEEIENLIMSLEEDPTNTNILNTYFRLLHTIKGTANCVGLKNIPKFAHKYEDLVVKLQKNQLAISGEIVDVLLKGLDYLKFLYAEVKLGRVDTDVEEAMKIFDSDNLTSSSACNIIALKNNKTEEKPSEAVEDKIGVSINILDNFMELSGQFTVLRNTLIKSAMVLEQRYYGDSEIEILIDSLDEMHKVSSVLQNDISEMRKVSLEVIYKPLRRVVRDSAKSLNKNIELVIEGEGLRVDTSLGKVLSNSLVHMIRNSVDHGIETPEKRVAAGKDANGIIRLKSYQDGENIFVELSDDGNGLNIGRIKQKAIEKGLFTDEQLKNMSEQKIFLLIFDSGFSTAQQVSDISGRGVGMDMVKSSIESIGGKISISSQEGNGTKFVLTLPVPRSVLIIKSLMIKSGGSTFSIPLDEVGEVVCLEDHRESEVLHNIEDSLVLRHHDELLSLVDLNKTLYNEKKYDQQDAMNIVIVRGDGFKYGIIVDEIMDIEEIVVKGMSKHLKNADCFMGITFIGHGGLALILDLLSIAEKSKIKYSDNEKNENIEKEKLKIADTGITEFMQFNLHKSQNYAIPLKIVNRLEEFPTNTVEFSGAIPLVRYREEPLPLLFIERQLELCASSEVMTNVYPDLLKVIVVNSHNKRFGIVVDEILDIGLTSELLDTNNVDRVGFMGTVFIGDKTVTIADAHHLIDHYLEFESKISKNEYEDIHKDLTWKEDEAA